MAAVVKIAGLLRTLFGEACVTVLSDPRWALETRRSGGGGLAKRLPEDVLCRGGREVTESFVGQTNFSMHLRLGGEVDVLAAASSAGFGDSFAADVGGRRLSLLPPHANEMHRFRPSPASTDFSEPVSATLSSCPRMVGSLVNVFSEMGMEVVIAIGGRGGEVAGLATLWPSSLVSSAVDATLGLLHVDCVLKVRGGAREASSSSVCSFSECSCRVNKDSLR